MYEKYFERYLVGKDIVEFNNCNPGMGTEEILNCVSGNVGDRDISGAKLARLLDADINRTYL